MKSWEALWFLSDKRGKGQNKTQNTDGTIQNPTEHALSWSRWCKSWCNHGNHKENQTSLKFYTTKRGSRDRCLHVIESELVCGSVKHRGRTSSYLTCCGASASSAVTVATVTKPRARSRGDRGFRRISGEPLGFLLFHLFIFFFLTKNRKDSCGVDPNTTEPAA